jgi:hypothetical protein
MTRQWEGKGGVKSTPFSIWIRQVLDDSGEYDVQDLDFIRFCYRAGWLITIEEKQYGAVQQFAQRDTQAIIEQMLHNASGVEVITARGLRPIHYRGHYVLIFEKTSPSDSSWVKINNELFGNPVEVVTGLLKEGSIVREVLQGVRP